MEELVDSLPCYFLPSPPSPCRFHALIFCVFAPLPPLWLCSPWRRGKKSSSSISRYSSSSAGDPLPLLQSDLLDLLFRIIASYGNPYWPTIKDSATLFEAADASWLSTRGAAGGRDDSPPPQHPIALSYAEFDPFPAASPLLDFMLAGSSPCSRAQEA